MTNKEYITATLNGLNIPSEDIDIIILKAEINGDGDVDITSCDNAIYNRFSLVLKNMLMNVSEGGYSISWNIEAVKSYYNILCSELGKDNVLKPKCRNKSNVW